MRARVILAGLLGSAILGVFAPSAMSYAAPPSGLTISPLTSEITIAPGTVYSSSLTLSNTTQAPLTVQLSAASFSVIDEQYDYAFNTTSSVSKWVSFSPSTITLAPGTTEPVSFSVGVPITAEPGGEYISLFATHLMTATAGKFTAAERVTSLLYINVAGNVSRIGSLLGLDSPLIMAQPSLWSATIQNKGTTHFRSDYSLAVTTLFGQPVSSTQASSLILPSTVRLVGGTIPMPSWLGVYRLDYAVGLGDSPAVKTSRLIVVLPPAQLFALIVVAIVVIGLAGWRRVKRHTT